ncbi:MAG TPA: helix-turn-helix transcriptional regulator [Candidatus Nitrosotenuis sp.]|jgi:predicted transcriptional regulator|nr:helix-turn-helix transcriptional regulator [Candidatus Nitrosotenuis sp.]HIH46141.1 helix-turn-helix transcriptional regulator [Candidatus Nitrosotenuis sp.]HIH68727.1 helix-turn-helix transcriptional regulator [Candidatus Nitrosotenuis sp.]HII03794.1 helix-turn-helix transcriptional regulator [Candidatus Nitrosotenuis sp.]
METDSDIASALADKYTRDILTILGKEELSAQQIATRLDIPTSTTYRKIKTLEDLLLIKKTKVVRTLEGLGESYYRSLVLEINVKYRDGNLSYTVEKIKMDDKIVRLWEKFKD